MAEILKVYSPFSGSLVGEIPYSNEQDIAQFLGNAANLYQSQSMLSFFERRDILLNASEGLKARKKEFIETMVAEGAKPFRDSEVEFDRAVMGLEYLASYMLTMVGREIPMGLNKASSQRRAFTIREPLGTILAISAFNHPLNLIVHQVAPAFAAGCPVIIKPASTTPLSCQKFVEVLHAAGAPKDWVKLAVLPSSMAEKFVRSHQIAHLSFIGSAKVGFILKSYLAPGVSCTLEHGGSAPVIIHRDADLANALPAVIKGGFYHAGQVCVSVQRVFIHEAIFPAVKEALRDLALALVVGDPASDLSDLGPMISQAERDRVYDWVEEARQLGAKKICGGEKMERQFFMPTILEKVSHDSYLGRNEAFGPILSLYPYKDLADAITEANSLPFNFQAAIFTQDLDVAFFAASRLKATSVMVNDHTAFRVDWMPFGGREESGEGMGGLVDSILKYSPEKLIVLKSYSWK